MTLFVPNFYFGYFNVTAYHNPTQQLNKLFALVIWLYSLLGISRRQDRQDASTLSFGTVLRLWQSQSRLFIGVFAVGRRRRPLGFILCQVPDVLVVRLPQSPFRVASFWLGSFG